MMLYDLARLWAALGLVVTIIAVGYLCLTDAERVALLRPIVKLWRKR
jgi:hypothetical protein